MDQLEHAVEAGHGLAAAGVALQGEAAALALDAQVLGARLRLDAEGEEVPLVRAVPDEEGAGRLGAQQQVGLAARHRAPVEAALLQLAHGVHHELVLALGAERLEAQAGVEGAAHPGGGELAVGDHGAGSQLCALGVLLPGAAAATPSPAADTAVSDRRTLPGGTPGPAAPGHGARSPPPRGAAPPSPAVPPGGHPRPSPRSRGALRSPRCPRSPRSPRLPPVPSRPVPSRRRRTWGAGAGLGGGRGAGLGARRRAAAELPGPPGEASYSGRRARPRVPGTARLLVTLPGALPAPRPARPGSARRQAPPAHSGQRGRPLPLPFMLFPSKKRSSWLLLAPLLTPPVPVVTAPPCSLCPEGAHRFQWIRNLVPEFGISSSHVKVLSSPAEFYELLKVQIKTAKQRVVMASLYLGTGLLEQELVDCLEETLEKSLQAKESPDLRVSILLDYTRGSRGRKNSRTMLIPLLQRFPERVRVSLFHTPNLRGLLRLLIPERFNETIGLQHIKVYLFDDNVILSGANLSDLYFTNRQDRYVLLQDSPEIADFFTELVDAIGDVSLQLQQDDTVQMMEGMVHPYQGDKVAYCEIANRRVMEVINSARTRQELLHAKTFHSSQQSNSALSQQGSQASGGLKPEPDTWIYPLIQMKPFGIQIDEMVTETLLTEAERDARIYLTTGYFNLTQAYMDLILGTRAEYRILLASPEERVQLQEYSRAGWTFHAKGLWLYLAGSNLPCLTLIGSPNFGYRSVHRDLEAQVAIVTENKALQQQLHQEQEQLYLCSGVVSSSTFEQPNRYVKLWVKLITPLIKNFF
uniref:CDP-diacylglycerol--glycerol-3-phosphate 3-phosphatidyltransferase n=1 Tax=Anser brachyrhynchus TaxID=132585 RepID=A0A8B9C0V8_9AVES